MLFHVVFSPLTLLIGQQEGHAAYKSVEDSQLTRINWASSHSNGFPA